MVVVVGAGEGRRSREVFSSEFSIGMGGRLLRGRRRGERGDVAVTTAAAAAGRRPCATAVGAFHALFVCVQVYLSGKTEREKGDAKRRFSCDG